ncbi:hypothetical protein [Bacillus toyonensis]|uniref:Uncharacterized protein n=1 Tax=Bacillus toyonensis TaxID=155322 RepID=A0AB73RA51_9BACI|nr:hypothetical protein [Bacillus toyonensis]PEI87687.1 hypothetical protein CN678_08190 [Bacillus toyonensis]
MYNNETYLPFYNNSYNPMLNPIEYYRQYQQQSYAAQSFNRDEYSYYPMVYNESPIDIFTEDIAITHFERTIYTPRACFSIQQGLHENDNRQNKKLEQELASFPVPEVRAKKCHKETCVKDPITGKKHCTTISYYCGSETRTTTHKFVFVIGYPTSVTQAAENRLKNCFYLAVKTATEIINSEGPGAVASGGTAIAFLVSKALLAAEATFKTCVLGYTETKDLATLLSYNIEHRTSTSNWH